MSETLTLAKLRAAARLDTAIFNKVWRGINSAPHQYEMASRVDDGGILYQADFWPRDHGKTEVFAVGYPLRRICENPNVRVLIVQKTATEAQKTLGVIKQELESNDILKAYYTSHWYRTVGHRDISNAVGQVQFGNRKESAWRQERIYCKRERRGRDPTVEAVGVGGTITGGHFDIIILDDIEEENNTRTPERLKSLVSWFSGTILQLREPETKMVVVGTLKTPGADIYNLVRKNPLWSCRVVPAILSHDLNDIEYEPICDEDGRVFDVRVTTQGVKTLWPGRWGIRELLLDMLGSLVRSVWIREKLNDLRAAAGKLFKREWFRYYIPEELPDEFDFIWQFWDTATEETTGVDWSVCLTVGLANGNLYVLDRLRARLEQPDLIRAIREQATRWKPGRVYIEYESSGKGAFQTLRRQTTLPLIKAKPGKQSKVGRANTTTVYFESGRIFFPADAPWLAEFEDELVMFPEGAFDDQVDVLVYAIIYTMLKRYAPKSYHGLVETAKEEAQWS